MHCIKYYIFMGIILLVQSISFAQVGNNGLDVNYNAGDNVPQGAGTFGVGLTSGPPVDWSFLTTNLTIQGGNGGILNGDSGRDLNASGGIGLAGLAIGNGASLPTILIDNDGSFSGGNGGFVSNATTLVANGRILNKGGDGVTLITLNNNIDVHNGSFSGGNGGIITNEQIDVSLNASVVNAIGGNGLSIVNPTPNLLNNTSIISGGTFIGGNGGSINSPGGGVASGGHGLFIQNLQSAIINDGTFIGGLGGNINGTNEAAGVGLRITDSDITVNGGLYKGLGIYADTVSGANNLSLNNITADEVKFSGNNTILISTSDVKELQLVDTFDGSLDINNGIITNIFSANTGDLDLSLSANAIIESINLTGTATNSISFDTTAQILGNFNTQSGHTEINQWNDHHFIDTTISSGSLKFNNESFNLIDGAVLSMGSDDASAYFAGAEVNIQSNAIYDAGYGYTTAQVFNVESGASVRSVLSSDGVGGYDLPNFNVGELIISTNATWTVHSDGTYSDFLSILETDGLLLAEAINGISNSITASDVVLSGQGWDQYWMYGISELYTKTNNANGEPYALYARYGIEDLSSGLGATGDLSVLLNSVQSNFLNNTSVRDLIIGFGSSSVTKDIMTKGFLRTAEMGSTLAGAQAVLSDQIGHRTREHLRSFRLTGKMGPSGARGPWDRSMNRLHDALPSFNLRDSTRSGRNPVSESSFSNARPSVKKPWVSGVQGGAIPSFTMDIEIPSHYQTWGRAYAADLDQESADGFAGYDASVQGGVIGLDRLFDHAVIGVAGGLSRTRVTGADGHSGEADSLQGTVYASYFTDRFYLNAQVGFASSDVETDGVSSFGYHSEYGANSFSFFVGAGMGSKGFNDAVIITPEVSLLSSKYSRDGYTSSSSMSQTLGFKDMVFDSYDQWSYQSELGVVVSSMKLIENTRLQMTLKPEFRLHWVHEFEPDPDAEGYKFTESTQTLYAQLQSREENLIRIGGGVRCWNWNSQTTEFGLDVDHLKGDAYTEWMFSGHFIHRF